MGMAADTAFSDTGGKNPVIILIHGLGLDRQMWRWQVDALATRYRVVTYDLLGHCETPRAIVPHSLKVFSAQLLDLMDKLEIDNAAVCGFSLGGMIARRFAMDHPDKLWALGVLHSAHRRDPAAQEAIRKRADLTAIEGPAATVEAALARWLSDEFRGKHPNTTNDIRCTVQSHPKEIYSENYRVLVDGVEEIIAPHPHILCPTLVMTGDEDYGNSPEMTRAIAAEVPGARTVILEGLRHLAMIEDPARFNTTLLSFLNAVRDGRAS